MPDTVPASLLDWVTGLATDPAARAGFAADPRGTLDRQGLADLDPADLHHAMSLVTDTVAARVDAVVGSPSAGPAVLDGESRVDALVRQFTVLSEAVTPPDEAQHPWPDTEVDDLDGPPPAPGDHDLDDHVAHAHVPDDHPDPDHTGPADHGLDAMHHPEGHGPTVATVSFLPSAPERPTESPAPAGEPDPAAGHEDHEDHGAGHEYRDDEHHAVEEHGHHELEHQGLGHHDLDIHDFDAAP